MYRLRSERKKQDGKQPKKRVSCNVNTRKKRSKLKAHYMTDGNEDNKRTVDDATDERPSEEEREIESPAKGTLE